MLSKVYDIASFNIYGTGYICFGFVKNGNLLVLY